MIPNMRYFIITQTLVLSLKLFSLMKMTKSSSSITQFQYLIKFLYSSSSSSSFKQRKFIVSVLVLAMQFQNWNWNEKCQYWNYFSSSTENWNNTTYNHSWAQYKYQLQLAKYTTFYPDVLAMLYICLQFSCQKRD